MRRDNLFFDKTVVETFSLNTVIVGSGAAGFQAALQLYRLGQRDIAVVTENINAGTSRNTGSDKQTYYKLTLSGSVGDSAAAMAEDLFTGGCVDGDTALVEAALSSQCFLNLCNLGVPFPVNRYGEYVGYKTDNDPRARAASAGPLTSKMMTEQLEEAVSEKDIRIFDGFLVISFITEKAESYGLLALNKNGLGDTNKRFTLFNCKNIIFAAGGPAGIYKDTVYPLSQHGSSGIAFEAGVMGKNLTEWQYGLASVNPRWNVSGTYMQVLPRFVSVDEKGTEREFLLEYFKDEGKSLSMIFQKGYEWPFDSKKVLKGSSVIDLLVYRECQLKRKVYLDFMHNSRGAEEIHYSSLSPEAGDYLAKAGACFGTPADRLIHMNAPAYDLFLSKGVDLRKQRLEIALCAQHNNGGLDIDLWWQTNISGFFAVGEVAGSHGVCRPGGSALNAGQAGALRAAQFISYKRQGEPSDISSFADAARETVLNNIDLCSGIIKDNDTVSFLINEAQERMSAVGSAIRIADKMEEAFEKVTGTLRDFINAVHISRADDLVKAYLLRDILLSQQVYLFSMIDYVKNGGKSRGSALYITGEGEGPENLEGMFPFMADQHELDDQVQEISIIDGNCTAAWRRVRPLPESGGFFENVWRDYRYNKNIY